MCANATSPARDPRIGCASVCLRRTRRRMCALSANAAHKVVAEAAARELAAREAAARDDAAELKKAARETAAREKAE